MKKTSIMVLSSLLLGLLISCSVFAAETGASIINGTAVTGSSTTSEDINISAGQVQEVNLTGNSITSKWAGFYGNLGGGIALTDGSGLNFYNWSVTDFTGAVIYAANDSISDWTLLNNSAVDDMPSYLTTSSVDNYTNTFDSEITFTSPTRGAILANSTSTIGTGGFESFALKADGNLVWATEAVHDGQSFDGATDVDYQLLVPAQTDTTYFFYMELP